MSLHFQNSMQSLTWLLSKCECANWNTQACTFVHLFLMIWYSLISYRVEHCRCGIMLHFSLGLVKITCWKASSCMCQQKQHMSHVVPTFPHCLNDYMHTPEHHCGMAELRVYKRTEKEKNQIAYLLAWCCSVISAQGWHMFFHSLSLTHTCACLAHIPTQPIFMQAGTPMAFLIS